MEMLVGNQAYESYPLTFREVIDKFAVDTGICSWFDQNGDD
jgi:hypothetical protein